MNHDICPQCGAKLSASSIKTEVRRFHCEACGQYERIETSIKRPWLVSAGEERTEGARKESGADGRG